MIGAAASRSRVPSYKPTTTDWRWPAGGSNMDDCAWMMHAAPAMIRFKRAISAI
jgi:hypothetical protein